VADGADCLGMAGGDGSQALVAAVAVEAGLPFVCIPAGTRNHFARDLGLDCTDPGSVLEAFVKGRRRRVDYGTVGDRLFVNNVSLGAYASIAQAPEYRESKLGTTLARLPEIIGPEADPVELSFTTPDGVEVDDATVLLVSNNSYSLGLSADAASRESIADGQLGVLAVRAESGAAALAAVAQAGLGIANNGGTLLAFDVKSFEVRSAKPRVDPAIDGEALSLDSPLRFDIHPRGLTLLLPRATRHQRRSISLRRLIAVALSKS
ncbi:MAG TPA: diacylglycerol kinase, partial [Actinobacteria bacterium]|nr:diacylglycerol kinase [Actinomycetota bacterium]